MSADTGDDNASVKFWVEKRAKEMPGLHLRLLRDAELIYPNWSLYENGKFIWKLRGSDVTDTVMFLLDRRFLQRANVDDRATFETTGRGSMILNRAYELGISDF